MNKDTKDYAGSEKIAIKSGKDALSTAPWLYDRRFKKSGFFVELRENNRVHPDYYSTHCVDGVGTKLFLAPWSKNFSSLSIDGINMNANDKATLLHADPDTINIYIAAQKEIEEKYMGEIMMGVVNGLSLMETENNDWNINIGKIETASLDEMISLGIQGQGYDLGIVMTGFIRKDKVPNLKPRPGNFIIGVSSTGLHSNAYTDARHIFFTQDVEYRDEWKSQYHGRFNLNDKPEILQGKSVLEAMVVPTASYFAEARAVGNALDDRDIFGINITGGGFSNFNRAGENLSFEITDPLAPLPIHILLAQESKWSAEKMYKKQNMGMGFAYIAPSLRAVGKIIEIIQSRGDHYAHVVGRVVHNPEGGLKTVIPKTYSGESVTIRGYL